MLLLAGSFNFLNFVLFLLMGAVMAGAIWLYRSSMEHIRSLKEQQQQQYKHLLPFLEASAQQRRASFSQKYIRPLIKGKGKGYLPKISASHPAMSTVDLLAVKKMLEQQQQVSHQLLAQIDQLQTSPESNKESVAEMADKVAALELALEQKEEQIQQLLAQQSVMEKLLAKMEMVQQDFDILQKRIKSLEQGVNQTPQLAVALEDSKEAWAQAQHEISKKSNKLQQVLTSNMQLSEQLAETEDKLQVAVSERQQLFKKVQLLESMNHEMQSVNEANRKLQTELRRISELESMLNMITEERNQLLRK